jgi:hypothetical protein
MLATFAIAPDVRFPRAEMQAKMEQSRGEVLASADGKPGRNSDSLTRRAPKATTGR